MNEAVAEVAKAVATRSASGFSTRWAPKNAELAGAPPLGPQGAGTTAQAREPRLHDRDQRGDGGERELEADAEKSLGLDGDDRENREGEIAHGQRPPVHDHGAEYDQGHDQRPLGADPRAGRNIVKD